MANGDQYVLNVDFMRFSVRDEKTDKVRGKQPRFKKGDVLTDITLTDDQIAAMTGGSYPTIVKNENYEETVTPTGTLPKSK